MSTQCDHEWGVDGPGVNTTQLLISCLLCGVEGEATITMILNDWDDDDDED